jgi:hypothetical protein
VRASAVRGGRALRLAAGWLTGSRLAVGGGMAGGVHGVRVAACGWRQGMRVFAAKVDWRGQSTLPS